MRVVQSDHVVRCQLSFVRTEERLRPFEIELKNDICDMESDRRISCGFTKTDLFDSADITCKIGPGLEQTFNNPHSRMPVAELFDIDRIESWMDQSRATADAANLSSKTVTNDILSAGFRLTDCHKWCTVLQYETCEYLALSYVWGQQQPSWLLANQSNVVALEQPFSLRGSVFPDIVSLLLSTMPSS